MKRQNKEGQKKKKKIGPIYIPLPQPSPFATDTSPNQQTLGNSCDFPQAAPNGMEQGR